MNVTPNGIVAADVSDLHTAPLYSLNGFQLTGETLQFTGLALPPKGDYSLVRFTADPGVDFKVDYPLPNPGAKEVYWYWPGSEQSAFRVSINLQSTRHAVRDFYNFQIEFLDEQRPHEDIRTRILIPKDIGLLQNYPPQRQLQRVIRFDTVNSVALSGINAAWRIAEVARLHGWEGSGTILDWGVGHGRVARHMHRFADVSVMGVDIDPENVGWITKNISHLVVAYVGPLFPPMIYDEDRFSLVYGISVMTHLPLDVQRAWLAEIARVLRPGGLALLTFAGDTSVAFSSRYLDHKWLAEYRATGRGPALADKSLEGVIATPDYYKNIKQTTARARELCEEYMDVVAVHECMFGYQDLFVLRKRG